ncbi:MAG TPA: DUF3857 and transglutaminase domain-containing protein [Terriglobales bacterium]
MLRRLNNPAYFLSILLALVLPAGAGVNIPDWARQAASVKVGPFPADVKAVILLDQTDYKVTAPGEFIEHSRSVLKILRPDGREYAEPSVEYRKDEKVQMIHAWAIDAAGNEYELKDKDFAERGLFTDFLYSDEMARTASAPAPQPGTVIAFEYQVKRREWINELPWQFQSELPVVESVLNLELPPGWEYRAAWSSGTPVEPIPTGTNTWQWHMKNVPGVASDPEPMMPSFLALAARMSVAYFAPGQNVATSVSWQRVGQWWSGLVGERTTPSLEVTAKAQQLVNGAPDFKSKLIALTTFLQSQIRYVEISIGIGGNQPHPANDVFRFRYGDCKDKVTLLKAMLQVTGISSDYVLIDTRRGFINPSVPSSWGNHAIIAIEIPPDIKSQDFPSVVTSKSGKRYIIFDPTDEYTPVGSLRSELQNSYALMVTDGGGELIRTPLLAPGDNKIVRDGHFVLSTDGAITGEVSEQRSGDFAMLERYRWHDRDQRERTNDVERFLGRSIQGFTLTSMDVQHADERQSDLLVTYKFTASQYGQTRGSLMLVRPRVLGEKSYSVEHKTRRYPLELASTADETDTYEIELPKDYTIDDVPDPVKIDVGFASYESKVEVEGSKLVYRRKYIVRDLSVPVEKYKDWVRLEGTIGADEAAVALLKHKP